MSGLMEQARDTAAAERERALTDADIKALADELEDRLVRRFYLNLGRGVWGLIWRAVMVGLLGLAAWGGLKNH
jgi:hypothetical protein